MPKTVSDIGEFGLIDRIHRLIEKEGVKTCGVTLGIGDDTAAIKPREGYEVLVTCDCLVEGRHYLSNLIDPQALGRRAMTVNISDIGAMGGLPLYALVSLGLKAETHVADVESLYHGFLQELNPLEASIIGGNITKTEGANFIDITLVGEVEQGKLMLRSSAEAGDAILVTGYPGQAVLGLQLLQRSERPQDYIDHPLVQAYNTPKHRAREGHAIARSGLAKAMIDTSDGLLADLGHICKKSGVGAELIQNQLPLSEALNQEAGHMELDPYDLVMSDSDDYELIMTCSAENIPKIRSLLASISDAPVSEIGRITEAKEKIQLILPDESKRPVTPSGWDHFKT
ncbi:MAG: thiamine-phosphate kinase [Candidatus Aminicenantaceae bacterium]